MLWQYVSPVCTYANRTHVNFYLTGSKRNRQSERNRQRLTERKREKLTERNRQRKRETDREKERETDREREICHTVMSLESMKPIDSRFTGSDAININV